MATHDYVISNASGAAVRADLNNALAAIVSHNSNATEPSTTYAYMLWADTGSSPPVMKLRNAANNGWSTLFQLDGEWSTLAIENGTAAAPSIYFKDSGTDTGLYSPGTNRVGITTDGTARIEVDASGRLLVGTSTARGNFFNQTGTETNLQLEGTTFGSSAASFIRNTDSVGGPNIVFGKTRGTTVGSNTVVQLDDVVGTVSFQGSDGTEFVDAANIRAEVDGTPGANDMPGRIVLSTTADGASSPTERMRIRSDGQIGFFNCGGLYPNTDNSTGLGFSSYRWTAVYAANGTIQTSDGREKTDVIDASLGSDFIKSLRPVSYKWIEGGKRDTGERDEDGNWIYESVPGERTHWGFIAQEVKDAIDDAGVDFGGWVLTDKNDPDSQQALRYDQFIAPLTKALQETMTELEALKAEVAALKAS